MKIPVIPHRRVNKIICLGFFAMAIVFFIIGGIYALMGNPEIAYVMCVLAAIVGGFSLLYGVFWAWYARKERKTQKKIERAARLLSEPSDQTVTYREFVLPRQELIGVSKRRLQKIIAALLISAVVVFVILYAILLLSNGFSGIGHLIAVLVFCFLIVTPGMVIQYGIFRKYTSSVPEKILLYPGKIIIDGQQFVMREIKHITISSFRSANRDTSVLYRKLIIKTNDRTLEYAIDYRYFADDNPRWSEYGEFLMELRSWAEQNQVRLTVDYMN